jgi:hypothetical protein
MTGWIRSREATVAEHVYDRDGNQVFHFVDPAGNIVPADSPNAVKLVPASQILERQPDLVACARWMFFWESLRRLPKGQN